MKGFLVLMIFFSLMFVLKSVSLQGVDPKPIEVSGNFSIELNEVWIWSLDGSGR